jgi:hypothetical protein
MGKEREFTLACLQDVTHAQREEKINENIRCTHILHAQTTTLNLCVLERESSRPLRFKGFLNN